jgi:hypothetical protein
MTASFLDVQVLPLPTSYPKEAVTATREQNGNAALSAPNAKRYSIVKEQCPQPQATAKRFSSTNIIRIWISLPL